MMDQNTYVAHVRFDENGTPLREQSLCEHLNGTAEIAAAFAEAFHARAWGEAAGKLHDVGKSSPAGQRRMRDPQHAPKCDHSTLGAQLAMKTHNYPLAYAIAGHHGHLPDGGAANEVDPDLGTLTSRMKKQLPDCSDFLKGWPVTLPKLMELPTLLRSLEGKKDYSYALAFFTRMLHSCLVDADYLDTEAFLRPDQMARGGFLPLNQLKARLTAYMARFSDRRGTLNDARAQVRASCLEAAALAPGFFSLTVPTGGGKTLSSLSFALHHAVEYRMERVIYAIPYTSILEQTADCFSEALGADQVVAHYADAFQADRDEDWGDDILHHKHLAAENWDAPVVVTTNVQLFESLYAAQPGRCRKLHHLARSVIVLDEAQLLPVPYLKPCLRALSELVTNYGASVVLMSATQPELGQFLPPALPVREITREIPALYRALKRTTICREAEVMRTETLAEKLCAERQVLCIVATRARAREIYDLLPEEGRYHLSTLMLPDDRRRVLQRVRDALRAGETCRLVSTSLVEAGVDVDFPTGWRERCGLDSILQAAGRVNREGRRSAAESVLHVFTLENTKLFADLPQRAEVAQLVFQAYADVTCPEAVSMYFNSLYHFKGAEALDEKRVLARMSCKDALFPFREVSDGFHLIEDDTVSVVILAADAAGEDLRQRLDAGEMNRELLRKLGASALQLRRREAERLYRDCGILRPLADRLYLLLDNDRYNPELGLDLALSGGLGFIM